MGARALVHGLHAVRWLLKQHPERVRQIWLQTGREDARGNEIAELARAVGLSVQRADARTLDRMSEEGAHQGVIAEVEAAAGWSEDDLWNALDALEGPPLLLVLDGVQDPHNLGACLRTADACGVHALIVPRDRAATLTPAARKVAAGAAETVPLVTVTNLARTLRALRERSIWIVGTDADAAQRSQDAKLTGPIAAVMGGEAQGLRRLTRENCDLLVRLPTAGAVESLNVSVATGMMLYEIVRQRGCARDK